VPDGIGTITVTGVFANGTYLVGPTHTEATLHVPRGLSKGRYAIMPEPAYPNQPIPASWSDTAHRYIVGIGQAALNAAMLAIVAYFAAHPLIPPAVVNVAAPPAPVVNVPVPVVHIVSPQQELTVEQVEAWLAKQKSAK
jgi:hypothetical protein